MNNLRIATVFKVLATLMVLRVTCAVVWNYREYFPPNFEAEFLLGRRGYFFGSYQWAFYSHIAAGPWTLIAGLLLLSERFRKRRPKWHRNLGRIQVALILLVLAPSGLAMAFRTGSSTVAGIGFGVLAIATAFTAALGWRTAVKRKFKLHRQWMWRCYLCLASAVVLRIIGGVVTVMQIETEWSYAFAAWFSWLGPLVAFEVLQRRRRDTQTL